MGTIKVVKCMGAWRKCCAINGGISADFPLFFYFFLADLSYVGFVLVGDVLDIQR